MRIWLAPSPSHFIDLPILPTRLAELAYSGRTTPLLPQITFQATEVTAHDPAACQSTNLKVPASHSGTKIDVLQPTTRSLQSAFNRPPAINPAAQAPSTRPGINGKPSFGLGWIDKATDAYLGPPVGVQRAPDPLENPPRNDGVRSTCVSAKKNIALQKK